MPEMPTTRWSLVVRAGSDVDRESALRDLFEIYSEPSKAFLRCLRASPDEAEDVVQSTFTALIEGPALRRADPDIGRFRAYLCRILKNRFLSSRRDRGREITGQGSDPTPTPQDFPAMHGAEALVDDDSPERQFDRRWVAALLDRTRRDLRVEYVGRGHGEMFDALFEYLGPVRDRPPYAHLSQRLGRTVGALRNAVSLLKRRFEARLRNRIAQFTSDESVDDEIAYLFRILENATP